MDSAYGHGRLMRLGEDPLITDRETAEYPYTTIIPVGRRTEGEPMNAAEQTTFLFRLIPESEEGSGSEESGSESEEADGSGTIVAERSNSQYFEQYQDMQTITVDDDIEVFDVTVKTAGFVRFLNNSSAAMEVTVQKLRPNS